MFRFNSEIKYYQDKNNTEQNTYNYWNFHCFLFFFFILHEWDIFSLLYLTYGISDEKPYQG